jgi:hypothetical protein
MPLFEYKIAAGYNNTAGLVNIESITPGGSVPFVPPVGMDGYSAGTRRVRGDGTDYIAGYASTAWQFSLLYWAQLDYLADTYCAGGWSGKVTIRTRTGRAVYANYNAVIKLPMPSESQRLFIVWRDVVVRFVRLVAI